MNLKEHVEGMEWIHVGQDGLIEGLKGGEFVN